MQIFNPSASFTRPANTTAYAAGQLIANSTTAGSVAPMQFNMGNIFPVNQFRLTRARLVKTGTAAIAANGIRIHLYQGTAPTCTNGDGAAWLTTSAAGWIGNIDVTSMLAFSDGAAGTGSCPAGSEIMLRAAASGPIYALLMALGAYTPISGEVFTLTLEELDAY
jgi:hypothetical protein